MLLPTSPLIFAYSDSAIFIEREHALPKFFGVFITLWGMLLAVSFFENAYSELLVLKIIIIMIILLDFYVFTYFAFSLYTILSRNLFCEWRCALIYFDAAATGGKKSDCVREASCKYFDMLANPGRGGHKLAIENGMKAFELRELIASFVGTNSPQRVVFTKNCSEALNLGIFGVIARIKRDEPTKIPHVITTVLEHNSVLRPLFHLKNRGDITLSVLPPDKSGGIGALSVKKAIRPGTRLVCMNLVSNVTGGKSEVEKTAKMLASTDIYLLCDGAQGVGHFDFDASNVDILCAPFHKALGGVSGLGFAIFSENITPVPIAFGGNGVNSSSVLQGDDFPESFEVGTLNTHGIIASLAGLQNKIENFEESKKKIAQLDAHLRSYSFERLKEFSVKNECGIFSFLLEGMDSAMISNILNEKYDIATRSGLTCAPLCHGYLNTTKTGVTRVSFDEYNTHEEIEKLATAIKEISKR